jgi:PAS domain S-box-containing protein
MPDSSATQRDADQLRQRAEAIWSQRPTEHSGELPAETLRLLHELEVHQIELEMQNAELQHAHEELAASHASYFDLFDLAPVGYLTLDAEGRIVKANLAAATFLGVERGELVGQPATRLIHRDDQDIFYLHRKQLALAGGVAACELRLRWLAGPTRWVSMQSAPIEGEEGAQASRVTLSDITERKQAEEALRASERKYYELLQGIDNAVSIVNAEGRFQYMNERGAAQLGGTPEALTGCSMSELLPEPMASRQWAGIQQVMRENRKLVSEAQSLGAGGLRWYRTSLQPMHDSAGRAVQVLINMNDIDDLKTAQGELLELNRTLEEHVRERTAELHQTNAELTQALRAKDEFLATMSHELRTPLNAVMMLTETLLEEMGGPLNERQRAALLDIQASGRHLLELITDVLDLASVEAGQLELHLEDCVIADVCQSSLLLVKEAAGKKGLKLAYGLNDGFAVMRADPRRLKQVLVNLLSNAVKFTPAGGKIRLEVGVDPAAEVVRFSVVDTGIGIAAEDLAKLFRPFTQVDSRLSRQYEGAGLGLALVRRLVELHGGGITVESEPGRGSRFTVSLPYAGWSAEAAAVGQFPAATPDPAPAGSAPRIVDHGSADSQMSGARILLVEDNQFNAQTTGDYLRDLGCVVVVAGDGQEALELAATTRPALILMDIQLPKMDGLEATRRLRAMPDFAATPIIALTALAMPGDRERCLAAGASAYLTKPFSLRELLALMRDLLHSLDT